MSSAGFMQSFQTANSRRTFILSNWDKFKKNVWLFERCWVISTYFHYQLEIASVYSVYYTKKKKIEQLKILRQMTPLLCSQTRVCCQENHPHSRAAHYAMTHYEIVIIIEIIWFEPSWLCLIRIHQIGLVKYVPCLLFYVEFCFAIIISVFKLYQCL